MNLYRFAPAVFDHCRRVEPDPVRGELELTAAVAAMVEHGAEFHVLRSRDGVFDLTSRADVPTAERVLKGRTLSF
jgi:dTDP-glucose pyrophosphorylase